MVSWVVGAQAMRHWRDLSVPSTARFLMSLGNVFFSLVLGAGALAFSLFFFPTSTLQLYKGARAAGETLLSGAWPAQYEPVLRALADERLIVYMGFVLATRITVGLLVLLGSKWMGTKPAREEFPL
jgi:Cu/Ag efflux pump CusA